MDRTEICRGRECRERDTWREKETDGIGIQERDRAKERDGSKTLGRERQAEKESHVERDIKKEMGQRHGVR